MGKACSNHRDMKTEYKILVGKVRYGSLGIDTRMFLLSFFFPWLHSPAQALASSTKSG
jgi:hypothetical protein